MFDKLAIPEDKFTMYQELNQYAVSLLSVCDDKLANQANMSALLNYYLKDINWVGFYFSNGNDMLILGPFQGLPACTHIPFGRGVCGTAAKEMKTHVVFDVHEFPGHIACDGASNSEIVVPIIKDGVLYGVLDIDSPSFFRFDEVDKYCLENLIKSVLLYI